MSSTDERLIVQRLLSNYNTIQIQDITWDPRCNEHVAIDIIYQAMSPEESDQEILISNYTFNTFTGVSGEGFIDMEEAITDILARLEKHQYSVKDITGWETETQFTFEFRFEVVEPNRYAWTFFTDAPEEQVKAMNYQAQQEKEEYLNDYRAQVLRIQKTMEGISLRKKLTPTLFYFLQMDRECLDMFLEKFSMLVNDTPKDMDPIDFVLNCAHIDDIIYLAFEWKDKILK